MAEDDAPLDPDHVDLDQVDLDRVVDEIRAAVAARTAAGEYSAAIDDELRSRVVAPPQPASTARSSADAAIARVAAASSVDPARADMSSSLPGGAAVHRLVGKAAGRQVAELAAQFNEFGAALVPALAAIAALALDAADDAALLHELDTVQDRLAAVERSVRHLQGTADTLLAAQRDLTERLDRLERAPSFDEG